MKKFVTLILICALLIPVLSGCAGRTDSADPEATVDAAAAGLAQALESESTQDETKAVTLEELLSDVEDDSDSESEAVKNSEFGDEEFDESEFADQEVAEDIPLATDAPANEPEAVNLEADAQPAPTQAPAAQENIVQPFATSTPQPNAIVTAYSECSGTGLGFKFRYPTGWTNIPGRSTICYIQPLDNGTVYPARVAVTMKKLSHRCTDELCKNELVDYLKTLRTQYDPSTFEVDSNLDLSQKFMSKSAMATSYLAYDGDQEVAGYVIMTYFERYVFVFHFLCAYEDYAAFQSAITTMRDSVAADG